MIGDNIKRIEEIRYLISKKTFDLMKSKSSASSSNYIADLESELSLLKQEMSNHLSTIQDAGYVYLLVNKKEIESLRDQFAKLSQEEKIDAFKGLGKGYELLSKSNSILKKNYEMRDVIANLIISLPGDEKVVQTIKNYVEGYSEGGEFKLESALAASRISSLISSLGFSSMHDGERVYLGNSAYKPKQVKEDIVTDMFPTDDSQGASRRDARIAHSPSEEMKEIEETKPIPATEILNETTETIQKEQKSQLTSEDLQPNLTYKEVCEKIEEIMNNYKMKRWVLGAFKDEEEKKQYEKIQSLLIRLMRLKQSMEEKGEK